ncbi:unnamed protein product [Adineta ricciae]|uniref:Uncharacterized protein n=1 Tax=Adineta ricciae TaxID=249248 RepID=A0A814Q4S2_ADIRI|nr:unnamed protein product [Adineta ricciae]CAF1561370.1 unnamed protein product [Adineta ricciae]
MVFVMHRETTPSGRCIIEKEMQQSLNQNEKSKTETVTKICRDKHHKTIKQGGNIVREYASATLAELNQIDCSPTDCIKLLVARNQYSELL